MQTSASNTSTDLIGTTTYNQTSDLFQAPKQPSVNYALESLGGFEGGMFGLGKPASQSVDLTPQPDLDSERFQQLWMQLPDNQSLAKGLKPDLQFQCSDVEQVLL